MDWLRIPHESGRCPVLDYQAQLENLCDQAMQEEGQDKLREVMDQILWLLAEQQQDSGEVSTAHFVVPIYEENTSKTR
jgi:hypothetical protein